MYESLGKNLIHGWAKIKNSITVDAGKDAEKEEHFSTVGGVVN